MSEWVYKATTKKVGFEDTRDLALDYNFLARSAYTRPGRRPARVRTVMPDDIIHFYYRLGPKEVETIGSFRVVDGGKRFPERFSGYVADTALVGVNETCKSLVRELEKVHKLDETRGYVRDPVLERFAGWAIEMIDGIKTPDFDQALFPAAQITLWYYPHPR